MSDRTTTPTNRVDVPYNAISNTTIATEQLQRAWCLMLTKSLWPTIDPVTARSVAQWLYAQRTDGPS